MTAGGLGYSRSGPYRSETESKAESESEVGGSGAKGNGAQGSPKDGCGESERGKSSWSPESRSDGRAVACEELSESEEGVQMLREYDSGCGGRLAASGGPCPATQTAARVSTSVPAHEASDRHRNSNRNRRWDRTDRCRGRQVLVMLGRESECCARAYLAFPYVQSFGSCLRAELSGRGWPHMHSLHCLPAAGQ